MNLNDLKEGEYGVITLIDENLYGVERLKELGFTDGTIIEVVRRSPFADPIMIKIRGCHLSIRIKDAKKIGVKKVEKYLLNR